MDIGHDGKREGLRPRVGLAGIRLSGVRLSGVRLSGVRLSGVELTGIVAAVRIAGVELAPVRLFAGVLGLTRVGKGAIGPGIRHGRIRLPVRPAGHLVPAGGGDERQQNQGMKK